MKPYGCFLGVGGITQACSFVEKTVKDFFDRDILVLTVRANKPFVVVKNLRQREREREREREHRK